MSHPYSKGNVVYLDPERVLNILSRILAKGASLEGLRGLLSSGSGSERVMPKDLNVEYVGRFILFELAPTACLADIGEPQEASSAPGGASSIWPGLPVRLAGRLRTAGDLTPATMLVWSANTAYKLMVRREQFLHLNQAFFVDRDLHVLGVVRSVPRKEVLAALIVCEL